MPTSNAAPLRRFHSSLVILLLSPVSVSATPTDSPEVPRESLASRASGQVKPSISDFITKPVLITPGNEALLPNGLITFEWEPSVDPRGYSIFYYLRIFQHGSLFRAHQTNQTVFSLNESDALAPGVYSWGVGAMTGGGISNSDESHFTVAGESAADGGVTDAGVDEDGGSIGEEPSDAGSPDAGRPVIVGPRPPQSGERPESSGCASSPTARTNSGAPLLLAVLGLILGGANRRHRTTSCVTPKTQSLRQ